HGILAVQRGERAHAHFHAPLGADAPFLWPVGAVGEQSGQYFEPGDDVRGKLRGKRRQRLEHAVDPPADVEGRSRRQEVQIAGVRFSRGGQQTVDDQRRELRIARVEGGQVATQVVAGHVANSVRLLTGSFVRTRNASVGVVLLFAPKGRRSLAVGVSPRNGWPNATL